MNFFRNKKILLIFPVFIFLALIFYLTKQTKKTMHPKIGTVTEAVYGIGVVTAKRVYDLKIGISSSVQETFVKEGASVQKGDPLIRLSEIPSFKAPFDGVVTYFPYSISEIVFPQTLILTLTDLKNLYLVVSLEQEGALRVKKNQKVRFSFESLTGKKFIGKVESIYPSKNQFLVHIEPENLPEEILPGMSADVAIEVAQKDQVLLIPIKAIHNGKVNLIRDGKKFKMDVQIGNLDGEWGEIITGDIQKTDEIILPEKSSK